MVATTIVEKSRLPLSLSSLRFRTSCAALVAHGAQGAFCGQLLLVWVSLCGTSSLSTSALAVSVAAAAIVSRLVDRTFRGLPEAPSAPEQGVMHAPAETRQKLISGDCAQVLSSATNTPRRPLVLIATLAVIGLSWGLPSTMNMALDLGLSMAARVGADTDLLSGVCISVVPGVMLMTLLLTAIHVWQSLFWQSLFTAVAGSAARPGFSTSTLLGVAGMCSLLLHAAVTLPMAVTVTIWLVPAVMTGLLGAVLPGRFHAASVPGSDVSMSDGWARSGTRGFNTGLAAVAAGILVVGVSCVFLQLVSGSIPLMMLAMLLTAAITSAVCRLASARRVPLFAIETLCLICLCGLPAVSGWLIQQNLTWQSTVNSAAVLMLLWAGQCAVFLSAALLPVMLRTDVSRRFRTGESTLVSERSRPPVGSEGFVIVLALALGVWAALAGFALGFPPAALIVPGVILQFVVILFPWLRESWEGSADGNRLPFRSRCSAGLVLSVGCLGLIVSIPLDLSRATQLLFSERSVAAVRRGVERDLIDQSDSIRLMSRQATPSGEVQVWRRGGALLEYRRNGMLLGRVSQDTAVTPQPIAEILPAILPLIIHRVPDRVLLVGDNSGACLRVCRGFPLQRIVALRSDEGLTQLVDRWTWSGQDSSPAEDPRVTIVHRPAALAMRQVPESRYDVLIISAEPASTPAGAFYCTSNFYQLARQQLQSDGILCQRFQQQGVGAESLVRLMSTVMTVFPQVALVQTVPGEVLLLAGNSVDGLVGRHFWTRLQHDYIRREIAAGGWDWSQVAMLPIVSASDPLGIFAHREVSRPNSAASGSFLLSLPFETACRTDRSEELRQALAPHQMRLADSAPSHELQQEMQRRLSALAQQLEILAGMPDEPWTYRKSLRVQLQRNPRAPKDVIRGGEVVRGTHPLDQHQLEYFLALSEALKKVNAGDKTYEAFSAVEDFTRTYEPLLSSFVSYELVRLHELAGHPAQGQEFRQRLHTVYFTDPSDASIRPVIAAIRQLVDHPEVLENDMERFDHMNSLIQKLIERWEARTAWEPRSAVRLQNDVDQSVHLTNLGLRKLEEWATAAGVDGQDFLKRQRFVNSALVKPLRDYRDRVIAHLQKTRPADAPDSENPDDLSLLASPAESLSN